MSYVAKRQIGKVKIITIIYFMICLMPFLRYYNFPGISVGIELLLVIGILVLYLLLITRSTYKSEILQIKRSRKWFAIFLVWAVLITFFYEVFTEYNVSNSLASVSIFGYISTIITALVIFMLMNDGYHNYVSFIKIYSFFVWLTLLVYLFQWGLYILGIKVGFNIPFLDFSSGWDNVKGITFGMNGLPSGLFSERAHFFMV